MQFLSDNELKEFLEEKTLFYNSPDFIDTDPVLVPHKFSEKEDIEISAFLSATIAWGNRKSIIKNALLLMNLMDNAPHRFILDFEERDLKVFRHFVHRTFQPEDCIFFMQSLKNIYKNHRGLGGLFQKTYLNTASLEKTIMAFRKVFFEAPHLNRTQKHVSDISRGAAAKRLNLYLRWMVRKDKAGVDFGLWDKIPMSTLYLPLDVHTANVARKLGLIKSKQNNWDTVNEITLKLRAFDSNDPVKYDYALFGLGIFEKF
jgi:uncharacterized protein (TIGR02757 family)